MNITTIAVVLALGLGATAFAQTTPPAPTDPLATPRIDKRQANQQKRIDEGVASGSLTQREAARLQAGQERNAKLEEAAKADGVVTKKERAALEHRENKTSKHIARQKHDRQKTAPAS